MSNDRASFVAHVIRLYLENPDTPQVPSSTDWVIAQDLFDRGIPLDTVRLAFQLAFVRRRLRTSTDALPDLRKDIQENKDQEERLDKGTCNKDT